MADCPTLHCAAAWLPTLRVSSLERLFPYDAEVLGSIYAQYNAAVWPAQPVALLLALVAVWLCVPPRRGSGRGIGLLLAAGWLWCGLVFFRGHLAAFDFMAPVYAWAFVAQAALLLWGLVARDTLLCFRPTVAGWAGLAVMVVALFGLPAISGLATADSGAFGWAAARVVGVAPGPTALFTLGLLLLAEGRWRWALMVIPLAWCVVAGVTAWSLGVAEAWPLPILGGAVLLLSVLTPRPRV